MGSRTRAWVQGKGGGAGVWARRGDRPSTRFFDQPGWPEISYGGGAPPRRRRVAAHAEDLSAACASQAREPAKVHIARPPAQRFRGRACSSTVGGRPRWSPELAAGLRERSRAENRAARRSQSTAERPTSTARSTCDKSGPVRPLRGLEGRTSSGWNGLKLGDRARAQCAPPRRVLLPPARTAAMRGPMGPMRPLTRARTVAGRANGARCHRVPEPRWPPRPVPRRCSGGRCRGRGSHPYRAALVGEGRTASAELRAC